jgi:hypothetical protein
MANSPSASRGVGELRHGVLGSADAIAQSLALLALTFAVPAAPASAAATAGAAVPVAFAFEAGETGHAARAVQPD